MVHHHSTKQSGMSSVITTKKNLARRPREQVIEKESKSLDSVITLSSFAATSKHCLSVTEKLIRRRRPKDEYKFARQCVHYIVGLLGAGSEHVYATTLQSILPYYGTSNIDGVVVQIYRKPCVRYSVSEIITDMENKYILLATILKRQEQSM